MKIKILLPILFLCCCFARCNSQRKTGGKLPETLSGYTYSKASEEGIGKFYLGREISYVMGAEGSSWLERNNRDKEENTNLAIDNMPLQPNFVVADIGAGTGYYSFRISAKVPLGKVFAVDIQNEMIDKLLKKKARLKDSIVEVVKSTAQSPNLQDNSTDIAIMVDVYHELEFPHEMLQALRKF